jgi:FkbM family methyltransferase
MNNLKKADPRMVAEAQSKWGKFSVMKNDFIGKFFMNGNHFEEEYVLELIKWIKPGSVVLDIGGNIGSYAIPFGKEVGEKGKVHVFEPQGVIFDLLNRNVVQNGMQDRINIYNVAVGNKDSIMTSMNGRCDRNIQVEYVTDRPINYGGMNLGKGGEQVVLVSLDEWVKRNGVCGVGLIKIDVEGAERLVIDGAKELIKRDRPVVFYEQNFKNITKQMVEMYGLTNDIIFMDIRKFFLEDMGYSEVRKFGNNYLAIP